MEPLVADTDEEEPHGAQIIHIDARPRKGKFKIENASRAREGRGKAKGKLGMGSCVIQMSNALRRERRNERT